MEPLVTTVIPTYRRPYLLRRAVESALGQSYTRLRVCVFDNNSGDETRAVVQEIQRRDARVVYHCQAENIGAINNFAYGLQQVKTPFFSFLSDDDILLPNFYEKALVALDCVEYPMMAVMQVINLDEKGRLIGRSPDYFPPGVYQPPEGFAFMLNRGVPTWTGVLFRREVFSELGLLDTGVGYFSDWEFQLRLASYFPYVVLDEPGGIFTHDAEAEYRAENKHLLSGLDPALRLVDRIRNTFGLPHGMAEDACSRFLHQFGKQVYRNGLSWAHKGGHQRLDQALEILGRLDHPKRPALLLVKAMISILPPARYLLGIKKKISRFKESMGYRDWKYRAKYRKYLRFERNAWLDRPDSGPSATGRQDGSGVADETP